MKLPMTDSRCLHPTRLTAAWRLPIRMLCLSCVILMSSLTYAQTYPLFNERRALLENETNTIDIVSRFNSSVVSVQVVLAADETNGVNAAHDAQVPAVSSVAHRGSGFFTRVSGQALFVTNYHVIEPALREDGSLREGARIEVALFTQGVAQRVLPVVVKHVEPLWDLALLAPEGELLLPEVRAIPLGAATDVEAGQKVIAIGSPFGLNATVTTGIVSAVNRQLPGSGVRTMIQTDAAINRGSSGGPLLNSQGEVIGINTALFNPDGSVFAGVGLAVPVKHLHDSLFALGLSADVAAPATSSASTQFGVTFQDVQDVPRSVRVLYGLPEQGLLVVSVNPLGSAAHAGLRGSDTPVPYGNDVLRVGGDVVLALNEQPVSSTTELQSLLQLNDTQTPLRLQVLRSGKPLTLQVLPAAFGVFNP